MTKVLSQEDMAALSITGARPPSRFGSNPAYAQPQPSATRSGAVTPHQSHPFLSSGRIDRPPSRPGSRPLSRSSSRTPASFAAPYSHGYHGSMEGAYPIPAPGPITGRSAATSEALVDTLQKSFENFFKSADPAFLNQQFDRAHLAMRAHFGEPETSISSLNPREFHTLLYFVGFEQDLEISEALFRRYDTRGTGFLSIYDVASVIRPHSFPGLHTRISKSVSSSSLHGSQSSPYFGIAPLSPSSAAAKGACNICRNELSNGSSPVAQVIECGHCFHLDCVRTFFASASSYGDSGNCPLCLSRRPPSAHGSSSSRQLSLSPTAVSQSAPVDVPPVDLRPMSRSSSVPSISLQGSMQLQQQQQALPPLQRTDSSASLFRSSSTKNTNLSLLSHGMRGVLSMDENVPGGAKIQAVSVPPQSVDPRHLIYEPHVKPGAQPIRPKGEQIRRIIANSFAAYDRHHDELPWKPELGRRATRDELTQSLRGEDRLLLAELFDRAQRGGMEREPADRARKSMEERAALLSEAGPAAAAAAMTRPPSASSLQTFSAANALVVTRPASRAGALGIPAVQRPVTPGAPVTGSRPISAAHRS